jgi:hypothetical protein
MRERDCPVVTLSAKIMSEFLYSHPPLRKLSALRASLISDVSLRPPADAGQDPLGRKLGVSDLPPVVENWVSGSYRKCLSPQLSLASHCLYLPPRIMWSDCLLLSLQRFRR